MSAGACTRCESPLERGDLRCALCGLPTPAEREPGVEEAVARVLRCHGCAAAVAYDAELQAPRCGFCGSVMEVETPEDPIEQAEAFVPFRVTSRQARVALERWLGTRGFFCPKDLRQQSSLHALEPLWWVGWMFDADVRMSWAADSDAGARRSRWAPHAGHADLSLRRVVVPASRGLTDAECRALVPAYDVADVGSEPEGASSHTTVEQFTLQRSSARRVLSSALRRAAAEHAVPMIPGSTHRKLHVAVLPTRVRTRRFAFPAYVLAYRYRERLYRAIVHGQDPSVVIGRAPLSIARIVGVVAGILGIVALIMVLAAVVGKAT